MNYYQTAIEGMPTLLDCCNGEIMNYFQRKKYAESFQSIYEQYIPLFNSLENGYSYAIDKDQYLTNMADAIAKDADERLKACKKKSQRSQLEMDLNLTMAVFVIPMVLEFRGDSSKPFSEELIEAWKRQFPKTNLQAADYQTIEDGFHRKWCYITTAVCENLGKSDNCYELNLLRNYRDTFLAQSSDGPAMIEEYYDIAPSIVKHIDRQPDSSRIYRWIWEKWISPCIEMIETNRMEECKDHYVDMVQTLKEKYFH